MRVISYIFLISQLLNSLALFADKVEKNPSELNQVKWKKVEENKSNPLQRTIWKSYKNDEFYFENKNEKGSITNKINSSSEETINFSLKRTKVYI